MAPTAPVAMNVRVAAMDRREKRDKPHMPWPEVQPEPICVPTPTAAPASEYTAKLEKDPYWASTRGGRWDKIASGWSLFSNKPPENNPDTNNSLQSVSLWNISPGLCSGLFSPPPFPDPPAILPCSANNAEADSPIIDPPINADQY